MKNNKQRNTTNYLNQNMTKKMKITKTTNDKKTINNKNIKK